MRPSTPSSSPPVRTSNSISSAARQSLSELRELQEATDAPGVARGYLALEEQYRPASALHQNNAIVPVVGNFGGPKALRAIGAYLQGHGATVSVFYTSNVEQYLFQDRLWSAFAGNVAALPSMTQHVHSVLFQQLRVVRPVSFGDAVGLDPLACCVTWRLGA